MQWRKSRVSDVRNQDKDGALTCSRARCRKRIVQRGMQYDVLRGVPRDR